MKSIIMKNILALVSILLSASALFADRLYIDPFEICGGETKEVSICLENSEAISAFQTDINLSTGLEIVKQGEDWMSLASRASSDHTLVVNTEGREIVRLVCFSNTNTSFSGNEGAVVNLRIKADEGFEGGWISLTNIKLSDSSNHDIILESSDAYVTGIVAPQTITISEGSVDLKVGQEYGLTANVYPENTTDKTVKWTSDNESVVTVDDNGYLRAISLGSATITATCGNVSASCAVTVSAREVESVILSNTEVQLKVGGIFNLTADIYPDDAIDKTVTWISDNEAVATVDANGNVTAVSPGTATITATCGSVSASCVFTVDPVVVESILLSTTNWSGEEGEAFHIDATVLPEDATDKSLVWTSTDETIATVDSEGNVSVLNEGICVITATAADGSGVSAECMITSTSGVDGIYTESENLDIYDINGMLLKKNCGRESLKDLNPGIYIIRQGSAMKKLVIR